MRLRRVPISIYARLRYACILFASTPYSLVAASIVALAAWLTAWNFKGKVVASSFAWTSRQSDESRSCTGQNSGVHDLASMY